MSERGEGRAGEAARQARWVARRDQLRRVARGGAPHWSELLLLAAGLAMLGAGAAHGGGGAVLVTMPLLFPVCVLWARVVRQDAALLELLDELEARGPVAPPAGRGRD